MKAERGTILARQLIRMPWLADHEGNEASSSQNNNEDERCGDQGT
jgi:hypothetical protein